jgi:hypothetical protein
MGYSTSIEFKHPKGNYSPNDAEPMECTDEMEVDLYYEGPDASVGILFGGFMLDWEVPATCQTCGHTYTEEEREDIGNKADQAAQTYEPDYPDYDED